MGEHTSRTLPPLPPKPPGTSFSEHQKLLRDRTIAMDQLRQAEQAERTARSARSRAITATKHYLDGIEALHGTLLDELVPQLPVPGDRVRMTGIMPKDPCPLPIGQEGTVREVAADVRQIYVDWDHNDGELPRSLILLTTDPFEIIS